MNEHFFVAKSIQRILFLLGIVAGIVIFCVAIGMRNPAISQISYYQESAKFGADYYTYSYDVAMDTAYNVAKLSRPLAEATNAIVNAISCLLLAIGIIDIICFGIKFCDTFIAKPNAAVANDMIEFVAPSDLPDL